VVTLAVGLMELAFTVSATTAGIALATWLIYVLAYTPLKARSTLNTTVGAISGSLPILIGWTATGTAIDTRALAPKGVKIVADDLWQRACFTLSARIVRTQFHGQTKEKLTTRHAAKLLDMCVRDAFELWLNQHPDEGKKIVELTIEQAMARLSKGKKVERKKSSGIATLPGKLVDCASGDVTRNELFLVEGDSAGGSAKEARDKETQALLPLRGKVLNTMSKDSRTVLANKEPSDCDGDRRRSARRGGRGGPLRRALRQGDRHDRRRRRRRSYPGAAPYLFLHARAEARGGGAPLRRAAAALQGRGAVARQGQAATARLLPGRR